MKVQVSNLTLKTTHDMASICAISKAFNLGFTSAKAIVKQVNNQTFSPFIASISRPIEDTKQLLNEYSIECDIVKIN